MRGLAVLLSVASLLALATGAAAADVDLELAEGFNFDQSTLVLGHLDPGDVELGDVHAVGVQRLDLPEGTLYVCSWEGGRTDEVPPVPTLQERCRNEDSYEDPRVEPGDRTWLTFAGNLTLREPPNASASLLAPKPANASLQIASATAGPLDAEVDDALAFRPQLPASQLRVETGEETQFYNGTDWIFYLEASGTARLGADGVHAEVPSPVDLRLTPAGPEALREALDARTLLDLQSAVLGPEQREPVANATRVLNPATQLPTLADGALVGYLNSTVGSRSLDPAQVSLVGLSRLEATQQDTELSGTGEVRFTQTEAGVGPGTSPPADVPWILATVLWVLAGVTIALGPAPATRRLRERGLAVTAFALALLAWDRILASALGTSATSAMAGEASLGAVLALAAFEVIALGVAWLLLALPLRVIGERWLVDRLAVHVSGVTTLVLLVFALLRPGAIVAAGRLLAPL